MLRVNLQQPSLYQAINYAHIDAPVFLVISHNQIIPWCHVDVFIFLHFL